MGTISKNYANLQRGQLCLGVYRRSDSGIDHPSNLASRGRIAGFTASASKRLRRYLRNSEAEYRVFITLTYPGGHGVDLRSVKRDLDVFFRRWARDVPRGTYQDWSACWFLEFQSNGRAHIHIYSTHYIHKSWLSRNWYEIVKSSDYRHFKAGTNVKRLNGRAQSMRYAVKYACKSSQKVAPDDLDWIGRFWGVRGKKSTVEASISFPEGVKEAPEVLKPLSNMWNWLQGDKKPAGIVRKVLEFEAFSVVLYLWPISDDGIRGVVWNFLQQIESAVLNL